MDLWAAFDAEMEGWALVNEQFDKGRRCCAPTSRTRRSITRLPQAAVVTTVNDARAAQRMWRMKSAFVVRYFSDDEDGEDVACLVQRADEAAADAISMISLVQRATTWTWCGRLWWWRARSSLRPPRSCRRDRLNCLSSKLQLQYKYYSLKLVHPPLVVNAALSLGLHLRRLFLILSALPIIFYFHESIGCTSTTVNAAPPTATSCFSNTFK